MLLGLWLGKQGSKALEEVAVPEATQLETSQKLETFRLLRASLHLYALQFTKTAGLISYAHSPSYG